MDTEIIIRMGDKKSNGDGSSQFKILGTVQKTTQITSASLPDLESATKVFAKAYEEAMLDYVRYAPLRGGHV